MLQTGPVVGAPVGDAALAGVVFRFGFAFLLATSTRAVDYALGRWTGRT